MVTKGSITAVESPVYYYFYVASITSMETMKNAIKVKIHALLLRVEQSQERENEVNDQIAIANERTERGEKLVSKSRKKLWTLEYQLREKEGDLMRIREQVRHAERENECQAESRKRLERYKITDNEERNRFKINAKALDSKIAATVAKTQELECEIVIIDHKLAIEQEILENDEQRLKHLQNERTNVAKEIEAFNETSTIRSQIAKERGKQTQKMCSELQYETIILQKEAQRLAGILDKANEQKELALRAYKRLASDLALHCTNANSSSIDLTSLYKLPLLSEDNKI